MWIRTELGLINLDHVRRIVVEESDQGAPLTLFGYLDLKDPPVMLAQFSKDQAPEAIDACLVAIERGLHIGASLCDLQTVLQRLGRSPAGFSSFTG